MFLTGGLVAVLNNEVFSECIVFVECGDCFDGGGLVLAVAFQKGWGWCHCSPSYDVF